MKTSTAIRSLIVAAGLTFAGSVHAAPVMWSGNGHYYDFVPGTYTWQNAVDAAAASTFMGAQGYLATITSAGENLFLNTTFASGGSGQFVWLGGAEPLDNGVWRWIVGPEAGIQFANFVTPTPPFNYANWGGVEPNDHMPLEDFLMFNLGAEFSGVQTGQWADAEPTPSLADPVVGYFVEYPAAVPEPSGFALLTLAAAGFLGARWKRRHCAT